jgi:hypothetical protein
MSHARQQNGLANGVAQQVNRGQRVDRKTAQTDSKQREVWVGVFSWQLLVFLGRVPMALAAWFEFFFRPSSGFLVWP